MNQPITESELDALGDKGLYFDGGTIDEQHPQTTLDTGHMTLDQIMDGFDYSRIGANNLKCVKQELQHHLVRCLDCHLKPNHWRKFLEVMSEIAAVPMSSFENAEDIIDVINILRRTKFKKCHFRAYSSLMRTVRQIDLCYSKSVGPLYNTIVKLDKQYRKEEKARVPEENDDTDVEDDVSYSGDDYNNQVCVPSTTTPFLGIIEKNRRYPRASMGSAIIDEYRRFKRRRCITI